MSDEGALKTAAGLARKHEEKIRFLVVGFINTVISYGMFAAWYFVLGRFDLGNWRYNLASMLSWVVGVAISYTNFKLFVFKTRGTNWVAELGRSYVVYAASQALNLAILNVLVIVLHLNPLVGQFLTIFAVTIMSFIGHKYFTFGKKHLIESGAVDDGGVFEPEDAEEPAE